MPNEICNTFQKYLYLLNDGINRLLGQIIYQIHFQVFVFFLFLIYCQHKVKDIHEIFDFHLQFHQMTFKKKILFRKKIKKQTFLTAATNSVSRVVTPCLIVENALTNKSSYLSFNFIVF